MHLTQLSQQAIYHFKINFYNQTTKYAISYSFHVLYLLIYLFTFTQKISQVSLYVMLEFHISLVRRLMHILISVFFFLYTSISLLCIQNTKHGSTKAAEYPTNTQLQQVRSIKPRSYFKLNIQCMVQSFFAPIKCKNQRKPIHICSLQYGLWNTPVYLFPENTSSSSFSDNHMKMSVYS